MAFKEPMVEMPKQSPEERKYNFNEVAYGYTKENALREAKRCLQCKNPQCVKGCPVDVAIPEFIKRKQCFSFRECIQKGKRQWNLFRIVVNVDAFAVVAK